MRTFLLTTLLLASAALAFSQQSLFPGPSVDNPLRVGVADRVIDLAQPGDNCGFRKLWPVFSGNCGRILAGTLGSVKL